MLRRVHCDSARRYRTRGPGKCRSATTATTIRGQQSAEEEEEHPAVGVPGGVPGARVAAVVVGGDAERGGVAAGTPTAGRERRRRRKRIWTKASTNVSKQPNPISSPILFPEVGGRGKRKRSRAAASAAGAGAVLLSARGSTERKENREVKEGRSHSKGQREHSCARLTAGSPIDYLRRPLADPFFPRGNERLRTSPACRRRRVTLRRRCFFWQRRFVFRARARPGQGA